MDRDLFVGLTIALESNVMLGFIFSALVALVFWDQPVTTRFWALLIMIFCIACGWFYDLYKLNKLHKADGGF